jgi:hypothetical protein
LFSFAPECGFVVSAVDSIEQGAEMMKLIITAKREDIVMEELLYYWYIFGMHVCDTRLIQ